MEGDPPPVNVTGFCTISNQQIGQLTFKDVGFTIVINLFVFFLLLGLFEHMRGKKSVYFCRDTWLKHRKPPQLPPGFLRWVRPLMGIPREKVLSLAGLDAYMLLRYIRLCLRVCLFSGFFGMVVLTPIYLHGDSLRPFDGKARTVMEDPKLISMGNIKDQRVFWVPIFFAYVTTLHTLYLLKLEYKKFLELRLHYLSVGDPDVNVQKSFSIMVDRIPYEYRTNVALYGLFTELFPDDVHSAVVSLNLEGLEKLVRKRNRIVDLLERAHASRAVQGREPTHWVPKNGNIWNYFRCAGQRVESVTFYQEQLDRLNAHITTEQVAIRKAADDINRQAEEKQQNRQRTKSLCLGGDDSSRSSVAPFLLGDAETRLNLLESQVPDKTQHLHSDVLVDGEAGGQDGISINHFPSPPDSPRLRTDSNSWGRAMRPDSAVIFMEGEADPIISPPQAKDMSPSPSQSSNLCLKILRSVTIDVLRVWLRTVMVFFHATKEMTKAVGLLTVGSTMSSTGFVTFRSMTSATIASQSLLTMEPFMFDIALAPEPRDIVWDNVTAPLRLIEWRESTTTILFIFLSLFWGALVSGLYKLQSLLQDVQNHEAFNRMGTWAQLGVTLGINYVPTLLLLLILQLCPCIFWLSSCSYERLRTWSDMQASVMSRYFFYQMVNIYVTIVGGALLDEVKAIVRDPRVIVQVLGCQVPVVAVYFIQVIITKTFSACIWEFSRTWPLIRMLYMQYCTNYDRKTARQRRSGVYASPSFQYGWTYPSILLVFTLCITYDVIMPIMLVVGALFFFFAEILYTFHLLYVYVPAYESGGKLWYMVFNRTLVALLLSHLTLIGYMAVLGAGNVTPWLIPLPLILIPFYRHCQQGYRDPSLQLSLLAARRIDASLIEEGEVLKLGSGQEGGGIPRPGSTPRTPSTPPANGTATTATGIGGKGGAEESKGGSGGVGEGEGEKGGDGASPAKKTFRREDRVKSEPVVVDYFQISAYGQPSLVEGPQEAEALPWQVREQRSLSPLLYPFTRARSPPRKSLSQKEIARVAGPRGECEFESSMREPLNPTIQGIDDDGHAAQHVGFAVDGSAGERTSVVAAAGEDLSGEAGGGNNGWAGSSLSLTAGGLRPSSLPPASSSSPSRNQIKGRG